MGRVLFRMARLKRRDSLAEGSVFGIDLINIVPSSPIIHYPHNLYPSMLPFPNIDPVAIHLGPLAIRWYSLAYIGGILLGWWIFADEIKKRPIPGLSKKALDDMVVWAVVGIVLGGRLGYVLFYKPDYYFAHLSEILHVWEGGMSFHGGMIGFITRVLFILPQIPRSFLGGDRCAGLRHADWFVPRPHRQLHQRRIVWPHKRRAVGHGVPAWRRPAAPSQPALRSRYGRHFVIRAANVFAQIHQGAPKAIGLLGGVFLVGYAVSRIIAECFREPDDFLGFLYGGATMGQILSLPMFALGLYLIFRKCRSTPS